MKYKCVSKFLCEVCGVRDSLQIFYNSKGEARYFRVRHRDSATTKFFYHQQSKPYADKELAGYRETLSQTIISDSNNGLVDLGHVECRNGQIHSSPNLENTCGRSLAWLGH